MEHRLKRSVFERVDVRPMVRKFSDDNPHIFVIIRHLMLDILTISVEFHIVEKWNRVEI